MVAGGPECSGSGHGSPRFDEFPPGMCSLRQEFSQLLAEVSFLLFVQARTLGSGEACPDTAPYCALDAVIEGFPKQLVAYAYEGSEGPLSKLNRGLFRYSVLQGLAKHSLIILHWRTPRLSLTCTAGVC
jgi:hypothetical protein